MSSMLLSCDTYSLHIEIFLLSYSFINMTKKIQLSNCDLITVVDEDIFEIIGSRKVSINNCGYAQVWWNKRILAIHRLVMDAREGQEVDHINRDKLDNRRENLRFCTHSENMQNKKQLGITWHKNRNKWQAQGRIDGKYVY